MFSFGKNRRLLKKVDFDFVFAEAKTIKTRNFIILYRENTFDYARIGFAISKKKIARAKDRNRIKRLVRESFRKNNIAAVDIIFLAQRPLILESKDTLTSELMRAWQKINERLQASYGNLHEYGSIEAKDSRNMG